MNRWSNPRAAAFALLVVTSAHTRLRAETQPTAPQSGLRIAANTTFRPGTYVLESPIEIVADGVALDGGGAVLIGADGSGTAVVAEGRQGVTIRHLTVERFTFGIRLTRCRDVTIEGCSVHRTTEIGPLKTWLDIWLPVERAYPAGILLHEVTGGRIAGNDLSHQQNGLSLYGCSKLTVENNHASYCSGWGIHLHNSSDNVIRGNVADFCNRVYTYDSGAQYMGADSAGLLMVVSSSRNVVRDNSFRAGGDGVFVAGYGPGDVVAPCNENLFEGNDCSLSPNNAFEATFCSGNVFRGNKANASNYGFWLGYSRDTIVEDNDIRSNRHAGVAIEHGLRNRIASNRISRNGRGVHLWTDPDEDFATRWAEQRASRDNVVAGNEITENGEGISIATDAKMEADLCVGDRLIGNRLLRNRTGVRMERATRAILRGNEMSDNAVIGLEILGGGDNEIVANVFANPRNAACDSENIWHLEAPSTAPVTEAGAVGGNYWSDYAGRDTDGDGVGDTDLPYTAGGAIRVRGDHRPLVAPASTQPAARTP